MLYIKLLASLVQAVQLKTGKNSRRESVNYRIMMKETTKTEIFSKEICDNKIKTV